MAICASVAFGNLTSLRAFNWLALETSASTDFTAALTQIKVSSHVRDLYSFVAVSLGFDLYLIAEDTAELLIYIYSLFSTNSALGWA